MYKWQIADTSALNNGRGKFPYEVGLLYRENDPDEELHIVAKLHSVGTARVVARHYWDYVAGLTGIVIR